jgi:hypothetical protein
MSMRGVSGATRGCAQVRLPRSEAKARLATLEAARAVAACLTPGMPPVEHVSILPRGEFMARIIYQPQARARPWPATLDSSMPMRQ